MKAKQSPLKLVDFSIFESNYKFIPPKDESFDKSALNNLPINIDFDHFEPKDGPDNHKMIEMRCKINASGNKPGYSIFLTASGIFEVQDLEKLDESTVTNLFGVSSINLMISNIRGYLINITSYGPLGSYILPPVNIKHLLDTKAGKK